MSHVVRTSLFFLLNVNPLTSGVASILVGWSVSTLIKKLNILNTDLSDSLSL